MQQWQSCRWLLQLYAISLLTCLSSFYTELAPSLASWASWRIAFKSSSTGIELMSWAQRNLWLLWSIVDTPVQQFVMLECSLHANQVSNLQNLCILNKLQYKLYGKINLRQDLGSPHLQPNWRLIKGWGYQLLWSISLPRLLQMQLVLPAVNLSLNHHRHSASRIAFVWPTRLCSEVSRCRRPPAEQDFRKQFR